MFSWNVNMALNFSHYLIFSTKRFWHQIQALYILCKSVESVKDLEVTIKHDLSWGKHVSYIVNKANKVLGVIKRSVENDIRIAFSCLFTSLVRPILEYSAPLWSPYQKKDIESLEKVRRRASRLALKQKRGEMM